MQTDHDMMLTKMVFFFFATHRYSGSEWFWNKLQQAISQGNLSRVGPAPFYVHMLYVDIEVEKKPGEVFSLYKYSIQMFVH